MISQIKILIMLVAAVIAGLGIIFIIGKYTTVGISYRLGRLHKQIEQRFSQLQLNNDLRQAKKILTVELNQNRLIKTAELRGELFYLCYVNDTCLDFEIDW